MKYGARTQNKRASVQMFSGGGAVLEKPRLTYIDYNEYKIATEKRKQ